MDSRRKLAVQLVASKKRVSSSPKADTVVGW